MPFPVVTFTPSTSYEQALRRAAECYGVEPEYWDIFGRKHLASPEVQRAILGSMGVAAETTEELDAAREETLWRQWSQLAPPVLVLGEKVEQREVPVFIPEADAEGLVEAELGWEDGGSQRFQTSLSLLATAGSAELRGQRLLRKRLPLPDRLKLGYHTLAVRVSTPGREPREARLRLLICPDRAYDAPNIGDSRSTAGVFLGLYGLRSSRNWGCGDFTDLRAAIDWVADDIGGSFVGLNPLHSIANRQPFNTSPYLPTCIFYRNPLYLDLERMEDFQHSTWARRTLERPEVQARLEQLRDSEFIEYEQVWRLKLGFLKMAFREFRRELRDHTPRAREFTAWVEAEGDLLNLFATHQALDEVMHRADREAWNWPSWPAEYQSPDSPAVAEFQRRYARRIQFHKYLQWQVDRQLGETQAYARQRGLTIGLYHDLALATDRFGADLWAHRDFYVGGCRVGAPPDDFSPHGQDWSFPPPDAARHRADGYRLFAESIRKNCRHGGALRIDHVMRFFRLYWIPDGQDATHGTYVLDKPEEWLHVLALESVRNQVVVIGEDLGTVEPEFREILKRFGIRSCRVFYFERDRELNLRRPEEYPRQALVSATTHDLPTLDGFWTGRDIEARRAAGLLDAAAYQRQLKERHVEKQKVLEMLHSLSLLPGWFARNAADVPEFTGELHNAIIGFLARTPSELLVLSQEDILKTLDQQNLPGSTAEYPNWRRKMSFTVDELRTVPFARDCARMVAAWIRQSGRGRG